MHINNLKLFRPNYSLFIPIKDITDNRFSISYISDEEPFVNIYENLGLQKSLIKTVAVPYIPSLPNSSLSSDYRNGLIYNKLKPIKCRFDQIQEFKNNFFIDFSLIISNLKQKFNITNYNNAKTQHIISSLLSFEVSENFNKILLYNVGNNYENPNTLLDKIILPVYVKLLKNERSFDKIIACKFNGSETEFMVIFDKDQKNSMSRMKSELLNLYSNNNKVK